MLQLETLFFSYKMVNEINLLTLNTDLGNALGIGAFAGGILITMILWFAVNCLGVIKKNTTWVLVGSLFVMGFGIVLGWLSIFFLIILICLIAFGISNKALEIFKEHGK